MKLRVTSMITTVVDPSDSQSPAYQGQDTRSRRNTKARLERRDEAARNLSQPDAQDTGLPPHLITYQTNNQSGLLNLCQQIQGASLAQLQQLNTAPCSHLPFGNRLASCGVPLNGAWISLDIQTLLEGQPGLSEEQFAQLARQMKDSPELFVLRADATLQYTDWGCTKGLTED